MTSGSRSAWSIDSSPPWALLREHHIITPLDPAGERAWEDVARAAYAACASTMGVDSWLVGAQCGARTWFCARR